MIMKMCDRCHKRLAVIFITHKTGNEVKNEGLCLRCAKEAGLQPNADMLKNLGISEDELNRMAEDMESVLPAMMNGMDPDGNDEGRAPTLNISELFGNGAKPAPSEQTSQSDAKQSEAKKPKLKYLDSYCLDLTDRAAAGKLDRVIGRDSELMRVMQILCRRQKNNPCLIGEAGVGKTAVAELLAQKIASGDVPQKLKDKRVCLVDMTSVVAGTQFRGQFESRMKGLIEDVKKAVHC